MGGQIALEDTYQTGDKDFSAQITKLKGQDPAPDILFISSGPDDIGTIVKQFRDAGIKSPIVGGDGYDTPLLVQIAGPGADDVYFTTHSLMDANLGTDAVKEFITAYQAEYKNPPENAFAGLGYDAVKLIADAIKRAGSADPKTIREALQTTKDLAGRHRRHQLPARQPNPAEGRDHHPGEGPASSPWRRSSSRRRCPLPRGARDAAGAPRQAWSSGHPTKLEARGGHR